MRPCRGFAGRRARAGLLCAALVAGTALASSQGDPLRDYREGEDLYERGDLAGALRAFEAAYASDPRAHRGERIGMHFEEYDPAFQIGRIHARLGNFEQAQRYFAECAANGYTRQSQNAAEFARWRAVVDRALALVRSRAAAPAPAATAPPREPPPASPPPAPAASPPPIEGRPATPALPSADETPAAPPARVERVPTRAAFLFASPVAAVTAPPAAPVEPRVSPPAPREPRRPESAPAAHALRGRPAAGSDSARGRSLSRLGIVAAVLFVLFAATIALSALRLTARGERAGTLAFGRFEISGLLAAAPGVFVYEARDRRSSALLALKLARPDAAPELARRFRSEADALERLLGTTPDPPGPRLIERGTRRVGRRRIEYVATEKLSGRTLLDFSRNSRRRFDGALCIEILTAIADRLEQARAVGLGHEGLTAEDVFLIEPLPLTAGRGIELKLLGLTRREQDAGEGSALAAIALELYRGRGRCWDDELAVPEHVPEPLRELLRRARDGAAPTVDELRAAFDACRGGLPGAAEA